MRAKSSALGQLAAELCKGSRAALSRAITLIESTLPENAAKAESLVSIVAQKAASHPSLRIGVSGHVGAGKSSLVEALGMFALKSKNMSVAVLAVDPSSAVTKGSILGDKTRMTNLATQSRAFIRPSPSGGALGGLSRRTDECVILCEAAGFDVIFIETVGVGQTESSVADACDFLLLLVAPGAGDALQGAKRGVLDLTDFVVVTKADGNLLQTAFATRRDYASALSLQHRRRLPFWTTPVVLSSIRHRRDEPDSIPGEPSARGSANSPNFEDRVHSPANLWGLFDMFTQRVSTELGPDGLHKLRAAKRERWMWNEADSEIISRFRNHDDVVQKYQAIKSKVSDGTLTARSAAKQLVEVCVKNM